MMDNVHTFKAHSGFGNYSLPTHFNRLSEQGVGGLKGLIVLPALQPVHCLSGSCVDREGHGRLVYKYTWSIGNCATWCNIPAPSSCRSLEAFKPLHLGSGFQVSTSTVKCLISAHYNYSSMFPSVRMATKR